MAIRKHEIPILEYDDCLGAVIPPNHEQLGLQLPRKAVLAFLYDAVDTYARANHAAVVGEFVSATKTYPIYVTRFGGEEICPDAAARI